MVFGRTDEERIQLNEDTYWSGGRKVHVQHLADGSVRFETKANSVYILEVRH